LGEGKEQCDRLNNTIPNTFMPYFPGPTTVTSYGKVMIKLRILRRGDYPGLSDGPNVVTMVHITECRKSQRR
jgi:hypothetical protein